MLKKLLKIFNKNEKPYSNHYESYLGTTPYPSFSEWLKKSESIDYIETKERIKSGNNTNECK